jgi:hypothetical protein
MNPVLRNVLAFVAAYFVGASVNMAFVSVGPHVIAPPLGVDITTMAGLQATMHLFEPKHFLFPWLGHALGTLVGAFLAMKLGASHQFKLAMGIGALFLCGGTYMVVKLPSPMWFNALDLIGAYLPMAWLGAKLAAPRIKAA